MKLLSLTENVIWFLITSFLIVFLFLVQDYQDKGYQICRYNAHHIIPAPEYRHHLRICSDRGVVEKSILYGEY